jgi:hypothetical protein
MDGDCLVGFGGVHAGDGLPLVLADLVLKALAIPATFGFQPSDKIDIVIMINEAVARVFRLW